MMKATCTVRQFMASMLVSLCISNAVFAQTGEFAIFLHLDAQGQIQVDAVDFPPPAEVTTRPGLIIWTENGRDNWTVLPGSIDTVRPVEETELAEQLNSVTRGNNVESPEAISLLTAQLDQLTGGEVLRGTEAGELITPLHDMMHLNGNITLRRLPQKEGEEFPGAELELKSDGLEAFRFTFPQGKSSLTWGDIPNLPSAVAEGLPAGEYSLSFVSGGDAVIFGIESESYRQKLLKHADALKKALGNSNSAEYVQLAVDAMLNATDEDGIAAPYSVDALDLLEKMNDQVTTAHLVDVRNGIVQQLQGERIVASPDGDNTGIDVIDLARKRIDAGRWNDAQELLQSKEATSDSRVKALARLYEAVILAESGQATGDDAYTAFMESLEAMQESPNMDRFRAHNNFANFLLTRAQDRLNDHAFQIASGVTSPLFFGLSDWDLARTHFLQALELATEVAPKHAAAVRTNVARQYSLLADYIRLLNSVFPEDRRFVKGELAATSESLRLAQDVVKADDGMADTTSRAVACEMLARIAHRERNGEKCRLNANQALKLHLDRGSLAGAESVHRMMGLSLLRDAEMAKSSAEAAEMNKLGLQHFIVSHVLSESLREQFPVDESGLSRAGFLARRAYVNEQIIELLILQGKHAEALDYAESAKARSLQDYLALRSGVGSSSRQQRPLREFLAEWPADTVALEYFLGAERAWVFVVDSSGGVSSHLLTDDDGSPIASRELVTRIQHFVAGIQGTSRKMLNQYRANLGFDKTWQDRLHEFYQILIPQKTRSTLEGVKVVQIVPHHILHYFPFAALVTKRDTEERISTEMVQPTFLIDESFDLCFAPSLTAWDSLRRESTEPITDVNAIGISKFSEAPVLPGVEKDLENLSKTFEGYPLSILRGADADEAHVNSFLDHAGLLFVATHGMNVADQPLTSFLLCHADENSDGRLTAAEILKTKVGARLVVLSACYSGLADRSPMPGDDLFGLQRALLQAGATNVVSGLWDVYDQTGAQLMDGFFKQFKAGVTVPVALANSQREFLRIRREGGSFDPWIHPYFWAVYKPTGSDLTRMKTGN